MQMDSTLVRVVSWVALFVMLGLGCAAPKGFDSPTSLFKLTDRPIVVAHRGGALEAPENTVAAIRHSVRVSDWQEVDVRLSKDGLCVVIHDDTVDRTTDGVGSVVDLTLAELTKLHAGDPKLAGKVLFRLANRGIAPPDYGDCYLDARLPTLEEVLAIPGAQLMIELKGTDCGPKLVAEVLKVIHRAEAGNRVALASFAPHLLRLAHTQDPSLPLIGIVGEMENLGSMLDLPISVLATRARNVEPARTAAGDGVTIWAYTSYSTEMAAEHARMGAHGVITDVPAAVMESVLRRD